MTQQIQARQDTAMTPKVAINNLHVSYEVEGIQRLAVDGIDLAVAEGEFVSIVGPSGCGKSTLLKVVAGLVPASEGHVQIDGRVQPPDRVPKSIGFVFQDDALLPWKTVAENISFPLVIAGDSKREQKIRTLELLEVVGLSGCASLFPAQLSGGMKKRVALARTMAYDPEVYLMDEPFGPLDAQTRISIGAEFARIWEGLGRSVMFVTHDVGEAVALSDRVIVISQGPGKIKSEYTVPLARPRNFEQARFQPEFAELHEQIWHDLTS